MLVITMDAGKSLKIASRRFTNGNYLLSVKKYAASRKEFDVALSIFERLGAEKEAAETLNNIGVALVNEGNSMDAREYFERSYEHKKKVSGISKDSLFNSVYNVLGFGGYMGAEDFERYYLEMKALGEELGGEHLELLNREKIIFDKMFAAKAEEKRMRELEELAKKSSYGALKHLMEFGLPCTVTVNFEIAGMLLNIPEHFTYKNHGKSVSLGHITPAKCIEGAEHMSTGAIEFEASYDDAEKIIKRAESGEITCGCLLDIDAEHCRIEEESFEHLKKFIEALSLIREDHELCISKKNYYVRSVFLKNAMSDMMMVYDVTGTRHTVPVSLTGEDRMLMDMMLSVEQFDTHKMLLLSARRLFDEENYLLCVINAVAGFSVFLDRLLKSSLNGTELEEYAGVRQTDIPGRINWLKRLVSGVAAPEGSLEVYLGDTGRDMEEVLGYYDDVMRNGSMSIRSYEALKCIKVIDRAMYDLKSLYCN